MTRLRLLFPALMVTAVVVAAGCRGGSTTPIVTGPTASPHVGATTLPVGASATTAYIADATGNTASFTMPQAVGGTANMTIALSPALPAAYPTPAARKTGTQRVGHFTPVKPSIVGASATPLGYVSVVMDGELAEAVTPSITFQLGSASIASSQQAYLLLWDPYSSAQGWIVLLGPGTVSGPSRNLVTFTPITSGQTFEPNVQYLYALVTTPTAVPTASPAPTPTATATPGAGGSLAAYCATIHTPVPNANSAPQQVHFVDNSGLPGAHLYLYVISGAPPSPVPPGILQTQNQYLGTDGKMHNFTTGATAPPLPLDCYPGSKPAGSGLVFALPPPTIANQSARLYIAYATPNPNPGNGAPPADPLIFQGTPNGGYNSPNLDPLAFLPAPTTAPSSSPGPAPTKIPLYVSTPWDFVEYTLPNGITDVSQVDAVGLPLMVQQNGLPPIGFGANDYQNMYAQFNGDQQYQPLAIRFTWPVDQKNYLARIISPAHGVPFGFPQDYWYNSTYSGAASAYNLGYIGWVMQQYRSNPALYTLDGISTYTNKYYCATSDGVSNILFYANGSSPTCPATLSGTATYTMPVASTLQGAGLVDGVCEGAIWAMPWGPGTQVGPPPYYLEKGDSFYLWKAMVIDFARGTILATPAPHPAGGWNTAPSPKPAFSTWYPNPATNFFNRYAYYVHSNMIGNNTYALQYDEPGGYAATFTSNPYQPMTVTIQSIPSFTGPIVPLPVAAPPASPCPT